MIIVFERLGRLTGLAIAVTIGAAAARAAPISICADSDFWPPYSFVEGDRLKGRQIGLVDAAMKRAGEAYSVRIAPWKRCLERAADGQFDALFGAAWSEDRSALFLFPPDAGPKGDVPSRLSLIRFVAVVRQDTALPDPLNELTMPEPVGIPLGYRAAVSLAEAGKQVTTAAKTADLLRMLDHGRIASAVMPEIVARWHLQTGPENAHLRIAEPAIWETPHFLSFARKGQVDAARAGRIWAAMGVVRADKARMQTIADQADADVERCKTGIARCMD